MRSSSTKTLLEKNEEKIKELLLKKMIKNITQAVENDNYSPTRKFEVELDRYGFQKPKDTKIDAPGTVSNLVVDMFTPETPNIKELRDGAAITFMKTYITRAVSRKKNHKGLISTEEKMNQKIYEINRVLGDYLVYLVDKHSKNEDKNLREQKLNEAILRLNKKLQTLSNPKTTLKEMTNYLNHLQQKIKKSHRKNLQIELPTSRSASSETSLSPSSASSSRSLLSPTSSSRSLLSPKSPASPKTKGYRRFNNFFTSNSPTSPKSPIEEKEMSVNEILIKNLLQHIKETISVEVGKNKGVQIRIEQNEKIKQFDPESEIFEMFTFPPGEGQIMAFVRQYLTASVMMGDIQDEKEGHEETERVFVIFEKYFIKHSTDYESLEKAKKNVLDSLKSATDLIRMRECIERFREIEPSDIHTKEDEGELVFHSNPTAGSRTNNVTIGTLQDLLDENTEPLEPGSKIRPGK